MREIRRKDRVLEDTQARQLLQEGEYGFLAMVNADGGGYGIPLNYVWDGRDRIWFHCAPEGHKLDNMAGDNRVTFTVVGNTRVLPDKFSTLYQSVMVFGTVRIVADDTEKLEALQRIGAKYSPDFAEIAAKYIKGSFSRTTVLCLDITGISAKAK